MNKQEMPSMTDPAVLQQPYALYAALRENAPVHYLPELGLYIVTSYDLLMEVMRDPKTYSNLAPEGLRFGVTSDEAERIVKEEGYGRFMPTIVNNDPPTHTSYRALVTEAFRAGRVRQMQDYVREIAETLIDGFINGGRCDAVHDFAVPIPMYVIADQLGVPRSEFQKFKEWSDAWVIGLGLPVPEAELINAARLVVEMQHYMVARMEERRAEPQDDILSDLVQADYEDPLTGETRKLEVHEVLSIVEQILVAGNETTTNGIANGIHFLATHLDEQQKLRAQPELVPAFVEEILRFESPVQGLFRYVTEDTELGGVALPKGSVVMIRYAAGNRDENRFENAEEYDILRKNNGAHIAFGSGTHHCVGSQLARLEMREAFEAFLRRFKTFTVAEDAGTIVYHPSFALRGPISLPITFEAAK